jgi:nitrite transporter NirC
MVAGMFITFGSMVALSIGGLLTPLMGAASKIMAAIAFSSALSLAVMAGCELFTGNNLVLSAAAWEKKISWRMACLLWLVNWLGNLLGTWILIGLYVVSGANEVPDVVAYFHQIASSKVALGPIEMVVRGILCNICVCLAIWCGVRMKSESGKLIMTIWCILIFMVCGFEHSIANMSIIGIALVNAAGPEVSLLGYLNNLFFVTIGNILGAIFFVTLPYQKMRH